MKQNKRRVGRPTDGIENYSILMSFAVSSEVRKKIKKIAREKEVPMSKIMRQMVDRIIAENEEL